MNANKQDAGGLLPCPFCGGEPIQYDYADGYGIHCGNVECTIDMFATSRDSDADARAIWNRRNGELCRAAPAGGDCRGVIPQALDETINGVVSDLEMIAAGKDQVTGDPVSGLQSQRIAKSAHDRLLSAWNACDSAPAGSGEVEQMAKRLDDARAIEEETSGLEDTIDAMRTAAALLRKLQQGAECFVREMRTSKGSEFFVVVRCNGRELTPHMYTESWKAEYDVASWQHLLCGAPEPDLLAYGPDAASQGQEGGK